MPGKFLKREWIERFKQDQNSEMSQEKPGAWIWELAYTIDL